MEMLDRYEQQAVDLSGFKSASAFHWDAFGDALEDPRTPPRARSFLARSRAARIAGLPQMRAASGPFRQMVDGSVVVDADQDAITGNTEAPLFPAATYTGFAPSQLRAGQVWCLTCFGVLTTAASSPGNITITPRFGTSSGGVALGASTGTALVANATNARWNLWLIIEVRAVGKAGNNSHMIAGGEFHAEVAAIAASTGNTIPFGSTSVASVDLTQAGGVYIGVTLGSASDSMKCLSHPILESLN